MAMSEDIGTGHQPEWTSPTDAINLVARWSAPMRLAELDLDQKDLAFFDSRNPANERDREEIARLLSLLPDGEWYDPEIVLEDGEVSDQHVQTVTEIAQARLRIQARDSEYVKLAPRKKQFDEMMAATCRRILQSLQRGEITSCLITTKGYKFELPQYAWNDLGATELLHMQTLNFQPKSSGMASGTTPGEINGNVFLRTSDLEEKFGKRDPNQTTTIRDPKRSAGVPPKYDWDSIWIEVCCLIAENESTDPIGAFVQKVLDRVAEKHSQVHPDPKTLRPKIQALADRLEQLNAI